MGIKPFYRYYKDEKEDKISQKIFIKLIVVFFVVYAFIILLTYVFYQNYSYITISGKSMQSTLNPDPVAVQTDRGTEYLQDGVYIKHTRSVDYGDIVVLNTSDKKTDDTIIKRVIGKEGDFVTIVKLEDENGEREYHVLRVKANTSHVEVLEENYIYSYSDWSSDNTIWDSIINGITYESSIYNNYTEYYQYQTKSFKVDALDGKEAIFFRIPEKCIFFLGDNRANSNDSRALGFFNISRIEGKVCEIVRDGTDYEGNNMWWINRTKAFFNIVWKEILAFFGANA